MDPGALMVLAVIRLGISSPNLDRMSRVLSSLRMLPAASSLDYNVLRSCLSVQIQHIPSVVNASGTAN